MYMKKYILEICAPGESSEAVKALESSEPFLSISKGDFLNPRTLNIDVDGLMRVVNIEHIIFGTENDLTHKMCIFTEAAPDTYETRLK